MNRTMQRMNQYTHVCHCLTVRHNTSTPFINVNEQVLEYLRAMRINCILCRIPMTPFRAWFVGDELLSMFRCKRCFAIHWFKI